MSLQIDTFCSLLKETMNFIQEKFPDDRDIYFTQSQIEMSINFSPRLVIQTFYDGISEYEKKINERDESFFLQLADADENLNCFNLGDKWNEFTTKDKDFIIKNIQKLIKLAKIILKN